MIWQIATRVFLVYWTEPSIQAMPAVLTVSKSNFDSNELRPWGPISKFDNIMSG